MSDWVTNALTGLGIEQEQAAYVAQVFRSIRTLPEPDALQVLLGVVHDTANQAEDADAQLAAAREHAAAVEADAAKLAAENKWLRQILERAAPAIRQVPWTGAPYDRTLDGVLRALDAALAARDPQAAETPEPPRAGTGAKE